MNVDGSRQLSETGGNVEFLLNMFGQMMRMPLMMMAQLGRGVQQAPGGSSTAAISSTLPGTAGVGARAASYQEGGMQMLVVFEMFETGGKPAIDQVHEQVGRILSSGRALASGAFSAERGGFLVLDVASAAELLRLLSPGIVDNCTIRVWPYLSFELEEEVLKQIGSM